MNHSRHLSAHPNVSNTGIQFQHESFPSEAIAVELCDCNVSPAKMCAGTVWALEQEEYLMRNLQRHC